MDNFENDGVTDITALEFFMAMEPPTATGQMRKVRIVKGKPVIYEPPKVKDARQKLMSYLERHRPNTPFDGPLGLFVMWCFTPGKEGREWRMRKPDTDNLQKLLKDCMTAHGFWHDDSQVCYERVMKIDDWMAGIYIKVSYLHTLDDED